jgi:radical SAM family RiPP maturation amino acid epimerase
MTDAALATDIALTELNPAGLQAALDAAFAHPEVFRPLLDPRKAATVPWMTDVARTKRFLEWWSADAEFRRTIEQDPGAAARAGLGVDAEELRFVWDGPFHLEMLRRPDWVMPRSVQRYRLWCAEKIRYRDRMRCELCAPEDPRQRAWRQRQVNRTLGQLGVSAWQNIIHAPFAIELSEGCSVGCWFCGVSAERKKTDFLYTEENGRLWRDTLTVLRNRFGAAAAYGFMYWATDPLDNPDYEKFGVDFAQICGRFPQTTTAQPQKHVERVRRLLKLSAEYGCEINRFSVLSLSIFKKIMEAFTAEELLHCELVQQNREASSLQSNSGRARGAGELRKRAESRGIDTEWAEAPGTISCVSGFLLNMVQRSVRLVTPCPSSDTWPDGHWVIEQGHFRDAEDLAVLLDTMVERHMSISLRARDRVRLRPDTKLSVSLDEICIESYGIVTTIKGQSHLVPLLKALASGNLTAGEIVVDMENRYGFPAEQVMVGLNSLFDQGILDEEPQGVLESPRRFADGVTGKSDSLPEALVLVGDLADADRRHVAHGQGRATCPQN